MSSPSSDGMVGILSRTIVPSTTIRWILPARIRHPDHNDVVFVGENVVQIRELLPSNHLSNISARLDLDCRILAAKVISDIGPASFVDQVVNQGHNEMADAQSALPSDILVLALDTSEIAFVYAEETASRSVRFRVARKRLPADVSSSGQFGRHLAVDARSTTLAVSPPCGQFGLLRLKSISRICAEITSSDASHPERFAPLQEERFIQTEGLILRMEFLVSPPDKVSKTVLALLVSKAEATELHLYSWKENTPLRHVNLDSCSPRRLHAIDRMPLLMIPSSRNASFILVTESGLAVYDNVLSPRLKRIYFKADHDFPATFVGSRRSPLWVQWAKPFRHANYVNTNDDFFLVREDGLLKHFEILHSDPTKLHSEVSVGKLPLGVDTAFAILECIADHGGGDICVVGGDMTDGAVYHIRARENMEQIQSLTNLAPIRDMLLVDTDQASDSKRTLVCAGKGAGHATIAEIRRGLEARIGLLAEQEDAGQSTGLWVLPTTDLDEVILIISTPVQTLVRKIDYAKTTIEPADGDTRIQDMDLESQTLAFVVVREELCVQITASAVTIWSQLLPIQPIRKRHAHCTVSIASINCDLLLLASVAMMDGGFRVFLSSIDQDATALGISDFGAVELKAHEPSSVLITTLGSKHILLVGTVTGWIHIFHVARNRSALPLLQCSYSEFFPNIEQSAICSLVLLKNSATQTPTLACGTRNGWLLTMALVGDLAEVQQQESGASGSMQLQVRPGNTKHIGHTSVDLVPDSGPSSAALLFCGSQVHRVFSQSDQAVSLQISRLWFTDSAQPEFEQPRISAIAALHRIDFSGQTAVEASFFAMSQSDLIISSLALEPELVPRKLILQGNPQKMVFAKDLDKLIVAIDQTKVLVGTSQRRPYRRCIQPALEFMGLDFPEARPEKRKVLVVGQAGSRITSLLTLTPTGGEAGVQLIVVGLYVEGVDTAYCDGRLTIFKVAKNEQKDSGLDIEILRSIRFVGAPVYSICQYDASTMVVCSGTELALQTPDVSTGQLVRGARYALPSPAVSLCVDGAFIYATTARHSLMLFEKTGNKLVLKATEPRRRDAIIAAHQFAGTIDGGVMAVASNKGGKVLGQRKGEGDEFLLLFDAELPVTINCLREHTEGDSILKPGTRYYGSTQEGALLLLQVLDSKEWAFLNYIARIAWRRPVTQGKLKPKPASHIKEAQKVLPTDMHINGDRVSELLGCGPDELRRLIREDNLSDPHQQGLATLDQAFSQLVALGEPLYGASEDPVQSASRWMEDLISAGF